MKLMLPQPFGEVVFDTATFHPSALRRRLGLSTSASGRRSQLRIVVVALFIACAMLFFPAPPLPPSYASEKRLEKFLPQHDRTLPFPEGRHGRFIK
jgi:hypothetical protein